MIKKLLSSQLRVNMASGMATTVINIAVMAAGYPIYLHFLGYEKYGVWLVLATVLTFAQLGNLGMGPAVMKLVAEEHGRGDIKGIQQYVTTALALLCVSGTVALIVILVLKNQIIAAFKLSNENAKMVLWLLPYIGVLSIYVFVVQVFESVLSGLGRMDLTNYIQSAGKIVGIGIAAALFYIGWGIESLLISSILSYLVIHIANFVCIWRITHVNFLRIGSFNAYRCKRLFNFGGAVFGGSLMSMLLGPFNKLMLSRYAGVSTVPVYEMAFNGSMQVRALFEAALRAMMPEISRIGANMTIQAKNRISQLNSRAIKFIFLFGFPVYVVLMVFMPLLLRIWLGGKFLDTLPDAFRIMMIAIFFTLVGVPAYYTVMGLGKIRYLIAASVISVGGNFALVIAYYALTRHLSVCSIGLCMVISFAASTVYLICKAYKI